MPLCPVTIPSRWSISATALLASKAYVTMALMILMAWSAVMAHEKEGFVILPGGAPRYSGPAGGEKNSAEILATRDQTGGTWGVWRYTGQPKAGPPLHIHRAEDEFFYVLRGEFAIQLGDCIVWVVCLHPQKYRPYVSERRYETR
jgi:mannose-6-phosphate isomerase-like protein (cupin superfamily)